MTDAALGLGAHAFIWSPRWDRDGARRACSGAATAGFDFVEIPLLAPASVDTSDTVDVLAAAGLGCTCSLALPVDCHLPDAPDRAIAFLTTAIDVAADLGSRWLTGALYGNLGTLTGSAPTDRELDTVARTIEHVACHAGDRGVTLGLEIINRYETHLVNTTEQALALLDRIAAPNVVAHLDTFHMNIEQASYAQAVVDLGPQLGYVHLAESNRGRIGTGLVPFEQLFAALGTAGYSGPLVVEAFLDPDPALRAATATWTDHGLDPDEFAADSRAFFAGLVSELRMAPDPAGFTAENVVATVTDLIS